ncbi:MAG: hypothetical protein Q8K94_08575 [Moraxellaceae bacterium]|nr:hypothetical protein [Moraxellaceae bacterium]
MPSHANIRITSKHYAPLCDKTLKDAVYKLPDFGYIKEKPLHSPENFAVVTGKNFQMTLVTLFLAEDEVFLLF